MESIAAERPDAPPEAPQGLWLDKGEDDDAVRAVLDECGGTAPIKARGEAAHALQHEASCKARRWVVERTQSWRNRCRRVLIRWDKKVCNYLGGLHVACASITYRPAGLLG
jgi:transposase